MKQSQFARAANRTVCFDDVTLCWSSGRVKLVSEDVTRVEHGDERLKTVKVALVSVDCSKSAVANPVNFILTEGAGG